MSRFLARALALARAEAAPIARPTPEPGGSGSVGIGDFGERGAKRGAFPVAPPRFDWPDGVDYWLTHDAVTLAGILNMGGSYRWCPTGGLDMWRDDGRYVGLGPHTIAALRAAGLLPEAVIKSD